MQRKTRNIVLISLLSALLTGLVGAPVGAVELDLESFLDRVREHSRALQTADKDVKEAGANKREAVSLALPHLSGQAGYTRNLRDMYMYVDMGGSNGPQQLRINKDNEYSAAVTLSQTLFSGGVMNAISAAKQYQRLTDFLREATYRQVVTAAKQAFYQTLLLRTVRDVARQSEENALANYQDVAEAFEHGLASEFQVLQGEVRWREAVPATAEAVRDFELALVGLKNLAGIPQEEELTLRGTLETYPPLPSTGTLEDILTQRPDYNALLWQEKLYHTQVKVERSGYLPNLGAFASYGYSAQSDEWSFDNENKSLTVGLSLSIPIFQGGETRARVARAKIQLDKARLQTDQAREDIDRERRSIRLRLEEAHARIASAEAALKTAQRAFEIAEATSQVGLTTQLELKDSRIGLDQATVGRYAAVFEYLAACFEWELVTGAWDEPDGRGRL